MHASRSLQCPEPPTPAPAYRYGWSGASLCTTPNAAAIRVRGKGAAKRRCPCIRQFDERLVCRQNYENYIVGCWIAQYWLLIARPLSLLLSNLLSRMRDSIQYRSQRRNSLQGRISTCAAGRLRRFHTPSIKGRRPNTVPIVPVVHD